MQKTKLVENSRIVTLVLQRHATYLSMFVFNFIDCFTSHLSLYLYLFLTSIFKWIIQFHLLFANRFRSRTLNVECRTLVSSVKYLNKIKGNLMTTNCIFKMFYFGSSFVYVLLFNGHDDNDNDDDDENKSSKINYNYILFEERQKIIHKWIVYK